jgi:hypothetical protein
MQAEAHVIQARGICSELLVFPRKGSLQFAFAYISPASISLGSAMPTCWRGPSLVGECLPLRLPHEYVADSTKKKASAPFRKGFPGERADRSARGGAGGSERGGKGEGGTQPPSTTLGVQERMEVHRARRLVLDPVVLMCETRLPFVARAASWQRHVVTETTKGGEISCQWTCSLTSAPPKQVRRRVEGESCAPEVDGHRESRVHWQEGNQGLAHSAQAQSPSRQHPGRSFATRSCPL